MEWIPPIVMEKVPDRAGLLGYTWKVAARLQTPQYWEAVVPSASVNGSVEAVVGVVKQIDPVDATERGHRADVLRWLHSTDDVFRREKPMTPPKHLVVYVVVAERNGSGVFLGDHIVSGMVLPIGGHVEPGELPFAAARREALEEIVAGGPVEFDVVGPHPLFVTVTQTVGQWVHTDVSLWFVASGDRSVPYLLDPREFSGGRWWTRGEIDEASPRRFDPNMARFLAKLDSTRRGLDGR